MEFVVDGQTLKPISNEVEVLNGGAFRDAVLKPRVKPLVEVTSVQELLSAIEPVRQSLETFGTKPEFLVQRASKQGPHPEILALRTIVDLSNARPDHAVELHAQAEQDRYLIGGKWNIANKLGLGDLVQLDARLQPKPHSLAAGSASWTVPTPVGRGLVKLRGFFFNEDRTWSSYSMATHGISAELRVPWIANLLFKGGVNAVARNVHSINEAASDTVRAAAGSSSLKVSALAELSHTGAYHAFKALVEAAGPPGDTQHLKVESALQWSLPLTPGEELAVDFKSNLGYIHSDGESPKLVDNFLIGGPGSVLGFKRFSLGPRDGQDFVGGQAFFTSSLALLSKIPFKPTTPLRFKTQIDTGVLQSHSSKELQSNVKSLLGAAPVISTAAGLSYRTKKASFDVLYVFPVRGGDSDVRETGLHVGVELNLV